MFLFAQKHRFIVSAILSLIALTFVGFGIGSYQWSNHSDDYLVKVGDLTVTANDFTKAADRLASSGKIEITPAIKQQILDELIGHNLLAIEAENQAVVLNDEQIARIIFLIPQLQEEGKFSERRYRYLLESRHETAKEFEQAVRKQFVVQTQLMPFLSSQLVSHQQVNWLAKLFTQQRIVQVTKFIPQSFAASVQLTSAEVKTYYQKHLGQFKQPEAAKVDFVVIPINTNHPISLNKLKHYYDTHQSEFEKRQISHILIQVAPNSTEEQRTEAKNQTKILLKKLRAKPADFSKLAKKYSQDPGSAKQGGSIGEITRGMTVKPFEDIAFGLKSGELSEVVATQYGYHIIRLDVIDIENFETVKSLIQSQLQERQAKEIKKQRSRLLAKMIDEHQSLSEIAKAVNHPIQHTDWITRQNTVHLQLSQPQALVQIFNSNTYQHQKISDVVYLNDGSLLVLTIKEKRAAHQLALAEAKPAITKILIQQKSKQFAKAKPLVALKALQAKQSLLLKWQEPLTISLATQQEFPIQGIRRIFATSVKKLPAYVCFESNQGDYWLVRINAIKNQSTTFGQAEIEQFAAQLEEMLSFSQIATYIKALRDKTVVTYADQKHTNK